MTTYYVWINCCAGIYETPAACRPNVTNCGITHFLRFESDHPEEDFKILRQDYTVPPCPKGGASRYLASKPLADFRVNGHPILEVSDLLPKSTIDLRVLTKR